MFVQKHLCSSFGSWLLDSASSNDNNLPFVSVPYLQTTVYISGEPYICNLSHESKKSFLSELTAKTVKVLFVEIQPN